MANDTERDENMPDKDAERDVPICLLRFSRGFAIVRRDEDDDGYAWVENL